MNIKYKEDSLFINIVDYYNRLLISFIDLCKRVYIY